MKLRTFAHIVFLAALFSILALSLIGCPAEAESTPAPAPTDDGPAGRGFKPTHQGLGATNCPS